MKTHSLLRPILPLSLALCCALSAAPREASATIYLVSTDPATHSVGMAVISSGPVVTYHPPAMSGVKGVGFTGWSGSTANISPAMDKKVFQMMRDSQPAEQIAAFVDSQIHEKYSRYSFISAIQGTMGHVFPPHGCAEPECGAQDSVTHQFFVMGGGLEHDVVPNSVAAFEKIHAGTLPFECKLLAGMQVIINVGGEIKDFNEAEIGIDNPAQPAQQLYKSSGVPEAGIVANLRGQIHRLAGVDCPATPQFRNPLLRKIPRNPRSLDLE